MVMTAREIADKLTQAQRNAMWPRNDGRPTLNRATRSATWWALARKGLVATGGLTSLGLEVRAILQEQSK